MKKQFIYLILAMIVMAGTAFTSYEKESGEKIELASGKAEKMPTAIYILSKEEVAKYASPIEALDAAKAKGSLKNYVTDAEFMKKFTEPPSGSCTGDWYYKQHYKCMICVRNTGGGVEYYEYCELCIGCGFPID